jgi:hypothetical protein
MLVLSRHLSQSGKIVNAYNAILMADKINKIKPRLLMSNGRASALHFLTNEENTIILRRY